MFPLEIIVLRICSIDFLSGRHHIILEQVECNLIKLVDDGTDFQVQR